MCPPLPGKAAFLYFTLNSISAVQFGTSAQRQSFRYQQEQGQDWREGRVL